MKRVIYFFASISVFYLTSCAAPSEPSALQTSGTDSSERQSGAKKGDSGAQSVDYGGAPVGDSATQASLKSCLASGMFFERRANPAPACTTLQLAKVACNSSKITSSMSASIKADFDKIMAGELAGYLLDQCLDCSTPTGNAYCEGSTSPKKDYAGIRLFLVKEVNGAIEIKTLYIPK